ncbi:DUF2141 domain-containing protein [Hyunsoonleella pacifica]|uniref:DUF2141 domain-containing protein n=1 Tax=Hyunsoonleella pacifica TaxID=1080224 RepID=A0A4V2JBB4_9FLAO|nr:DUF2141 domain-containing protein [Hyunsoonleella pacifica]TBN18611.1 DUF2141 domain-containing protein [Hyunsoonleella pacifica]GGD03198.1 hypothetical protein GCM10011368_01330 [Hyunsoonleella pacifica]
MQQLIKIICFIVISTSLSFAQEIIENNVTVTISNLESNDGKVFISLYNSEGSFLAKGYQSTVSEIKNNSCEVVFKNIPNGTYAVSFYHDENSNNKMDTGMFGIPKEDYGCSNNAKGFMGPPKWKDAKFTINNESVTQHITL